jgi:hypothetical protein
MRGNNKKGPRGLRLKRASSDDSHNCPLSPRAPDAPLRQMSVVRFGEHAREASMSSNRDVLEGLQSEPAVSSGGKFNRGERHAVSEAVERRESRIHGTFGGSNALDSMTDRGPTSRPVSPKGPAKSSDLRDNSFLTRDNTPASPASPSRRKKKKEEEESVKFIYGLKAIFRAMGSSS